MRSTSARCANRLYGGLSKDASKQSYRFLWLRTFHHPVSARLEVAKDGAAQLFVKVLNGQGGYEIGHTVLNRHIKSPKEAVDHFLELLQEADFWNTPTEQPESNEIGADARWRTRSRPRFRPLPARW